MDTKPLPPWSLFQTVAGTHFFVKLCELGVQT